MKLTHTYRAKRKSGMTLLELTVVIVVLLSLISILFVGARAWKKGSDRAANIMNLRNCQQAMRGHQNMYSLNATDAFDQDALEDYMRMPQPIGSAVTGYAAGTVITAYAADPPVDDAHIWLRATPADDAMPYTGATRNDYGPALAETAEW